MADHAGTATHVAFVHATGGGPVEGLLDVRGGDVSPVDVVEESVPSLGYREPPEQVLQGSCLGFRGDQGVAHDPDRMRGAECKRGHHHSGVTHPGQSGDLAVAVQREGTSEDGSRPRVGVARQDDRDARADRSGADSQRPGAFDESDVFDPHPRHIGEGVPGSGVGGSDPDPQVPGSKGGGLGRRRRPHLAHLLEGRDIGRYRSGRRSLKTSFLAPSRLSRAA